MSNVTGNTTQSFGIIKYVCNIPYIMLIAQLEPRPWQSSHQSIIQTDNELTGQTFTHTFALICVFVKNCLCGYNFPIPKEKTKNRNTCYCVLITYVIIFAHIQERDLVLLKNVSLILLERFLLPLQFNKHLQSSSEKHRSFAIACLPLVAALYSSVNAKYRGNFRSSALLKTLLWLS